MTQTVHYGQNFDPTSVFVDDVYLEVVPPQAYFQGVPTSVFGTVGTASWGAKNVAQLISAPSEIVSHFGGNVDANDDHDLCWDLSVAINQGGQNAGLVGYGIRVSDGTDVEASLNLMDSAAPGESATLGGTLTTGNVVNLKLINPNFAGGFYIVQFAVTGSESTLTLLATAIKDAINADSVLIAAGFTAESSGAVLSFSWPYTLGAIIFDKSVNGVTTATVGGTATTGNILYLTVIDENLVGGQLTVSYTVQGGDTTTTIATGLKDAINAEGELDDIGVSATSSGAVVSITSTSTEQTTYTRDVGAGTATISFGGGATETVTYADLTLLGAVLTARHSGIKGNEINVSLQAGSQSDTCTVVITPFDGAGPSEIFADLPTTASTFWVALVNAINMGQSSSRPPSQWVVGSDASVSAVAPLFGTFLLAGGTDGRSGVTAGDLLGSETGGEDAGASGIYCLGNDLDFPASVCWLAGVTDASVYPALASFAINNNTFALGTFAAAQTVAQVVASKLSYGIADYHFGYVYQWVYLFDTFNNITRLCPPLAVAGGSIATLAPEQSPFNKKVQSVIGTERNNPYSGNTRFSNAELAQLAKTGIMLLSNPIPGFRAFGFRNGYNSVGNKQPTSVVEYSRLTNFLVQSNGQVLGQFEGRLQGQGPNDPLRAEVSATLNQFYGALKAQGRIDDFSVICNNTNNSPASIAQHVLRISESVRYLASVLTIFAQIQGGTTVQTLANQVAPTIPGT